MDDTDTISTMPSGDAFAGVIGRLLLTQGEVRRLLGQAGGVAVIAPGWDCDRERLGAVAGALAEALRLVGDDALVARWLRSPLPRRGGASPLEEVESVSGDRLIRFVLSPHPVELVRLVADQARAAADTVRPARRLERHVHA